MEKPTTIRTRFFHGIMICALYMAVGPALVLLNKHILSEVGFKYPMLLSSLGLIFAAFAAHLVSAQLQALRICPFRGENTITLPFVVARLANQLAALGIITIGKRHIVTWRFWLVRVLPVGACHAATLAFGNAQYLYMGVALIQFLKAFTPIVVTAISALVLRDRPSRAVVASLIVLCAGTAVTAADDVAVSAFGLLLAMGSASTEAIRLVLTQ